MKILTLTLIFLLGAIRPARNGAASSNFPCIASRKLSIPHWWMMTPLRPCVTYRRRPCARGPLDPAAGACPGAFLTVLDAGKTLRFRLREGVNFSDGTPFTADTSSLRSNADGSELAFSRRGLVAAGRGRRARLSRWRVYRDHPFSRSAGGGVGLFDQIAILRDDLRSRKVPCWGHSTCPAAKPGIYLRLERIRITGRCSLAAGCRTWIRFSSISSRTATSSFCAPARRATPAFIPRFDQFDDLAREKPGWAKDAGPALENELLWFNMASSAPLPAHQKVWFSSRNFRLAVSHAIRRDDLCRVVYRGHAAPGIGPFPPANLFWFNRKLKPPAFDLELARRLLAEDSFRMDGRKLRGRSGNPVEFSIITNAGNKARERMASMIQQDLAAIGIQVTS